MRTCFRQSSSHPSERSAAPLSPSAVASSRSSSNCRRSWSTVWPRDPKSGSAMRCCRISSIVSFNNTVRSWRIAVKPLIMPRENLQFAGSSANETGISERRDHLAICRAPRQPRHHFVRGVDVTAEAIECSHFSVLIRMLSPLAPSTPATASLGSAPAAQAP